MHQQAVADFNSLLSTILRRYDEHLHAWMPCSQTSILTWQPPYQGCFKINFDVSTIRHKLVFPAVCHNSRGDILQVHAGARLGSNPLKGEALAARLAVSYFPEFDQAAVIVEGDVLMLIE